METTYNFTAIANMPNVISNIFTYVSTSKKFARMIVKAYLGSDEKGYLSNSMIEAATNYLHYVFSRTEPVMLDYFLTRNLSLVVPQSIITQMSNMKDEKLPYHIDKVVDLSLNDVRFLPITDNIRFNNVRSITALNMTDFRNVDCPNLKEVRFTREIFTVQPGVEHLIVDMNSVYEKHIALFFQTPFPDVVTADLFYVVTAGNITIRLRKPKGQKYFDLFTLPEITDYESLHNPLICNKIQSFTFSQNSCYIRLERHNYNKSSNYPTDSIVPRIVGLETGGNSIVLECENYKSIYIIGGINILWNIKDSPYLEFLDINPSYGINFAVQPNVFPSLTTYKTSKYSAEILNKAIYLPCVTLAGFIPDNLVLNTINDITILALNESDFNKNIVAKNARTISFISFGQGNDENDIQRSIKRISCNAPGTYTGMKFVSAHKIN